MSFIDKALERAKALHKKKEKPVSLAGLPNSAYASTSPEVAGITEREFTPQDIFYTVTRVVAVDPENLRRHRLLAGGGEAEAAVAEGYKVLRTHILQRTAEEGHNTLMITSPLPGEGKTLTAINLAISISQGLNYTVLLVDADLRFPSISKYFGLADEPGLADHLTSGVPIDELLIHPEGLAKLVILPAGQPVSQAAELLNSPLMRDLVQELKHFYTNRYVIFDLPPVLTFADALAFAPLMDGIILVIEAGKTAREEIERCQELLKKFRLLGFVLNKAEKTKNLGYYQGYYDYKKPARGAKRKFKFPFFK
ncbi:MAG: CpsD/CapB family tyrosine-protein kinase [Desulfobaccales bacterium]